MASRGRKPSPRPRAGGDAFAGEPACPETVAGDELARGEWARIVPILLEMGLLGRPDGPALGAYCLAYATWVRAEAEVLAGGLVVNTDLGGCKANPAVAAAKDARRQMVAFLAEFGCTPASRARLIPGRPKADDLSEFIEDA